MFNYQARLVWYGRTWRACGTNHKIPSGKGLFHLHIILIAIPVQASAEHCVLGLRIFGQLVSSMNQRKVGSLSLANHRKTATSFRDSCLLDIFRISLTTLSQLVTKTAVIGDGTSDDLIYEEWFYWCLHFYTAKLEDDLKDYSLSLALECLSFDFIGTAPDDASNDTATIQIPSSWCTLIQDPATLGLFLDLYQVSQPPRSTQVCLSNRSHTI